MNDRSEPDAEMRSPLAGDPAAQRRSASPRAAIAAACAAIGGGAMYFSVLIPYAFLGPSTDTDWRRFDASLAMWSSGMILILIALIVQPPGRARVYTRAAFLLVVLAAVLSHIFAFDMSFPAQMGWWW